MAFYLLLTRIVMLLAVKSRNVPHADFLKWRRLRTFLLTIANFAATTKKLARIKRLFLIVFATKITHRANFQ